MHGDVLKSTTMMIIIVLIIILIFINYEVHPHDTNITQQLIRQSC
jgi:hypothetical protein